MKSMKLITIFACLSGAASCIGMKRPIVPEQQEAYITDNIFKDVFAKLVNETTLENHTHARMTALSNLAYLKKNNPDRFKFEKIIVQSANRHANDIIVDVYAYIRHIHPYFFNKLYPQVSRYINFSVARRALRWATRR